MSSPALYAGDEIFSDRCEIEHQFLVLNLMEKNTLNLEIY